MRLTHIKLAGFKSFVDPTTIHVPGQLVAVCGPNGCGKSNVIDAVRWVLGESSAKQLRGESMQDVIFNGSTSRKPVSRASVELVFDNREGLAAGQWSQYAEISIKRVLTRQGDSDYYINNLAVRRRDITDLFLGTGVGKGGYAIIEQGMISRIIEAKPEELRHFLEEAAGVSKYKERRRETESRLADTRDNLARLDDIRRELATQVEKLGEQAEVASEYQRLQALITEKQQLLALQRKRDAESELDQARVAIAAAQAALDARIAMVRSHEAEIEALRERHADATDSVHGAQVALFDANAVVARYEQQLLHVRQTRERLQQQLALGRDELAKVELQRIACDDDAALWQQKRDDALLTVEEAAIGFDDEMRQQPELESALRAQDAALQTLRDAQAVAQASQRLAQQQMQQADKAAATLAARKARLDSELVNAADDHAADIEALRCEADAARVGIEDRTLAIELQDEAQEHERGVLADLHAERERLMLARTDAAARMAALEADSPVQDDTALAHWLDLQGLRDAPTLLSQLDIDPVWATAVEVLLGEMLNGRIATALPAVAAPAALSMLEPTKAVLQPESQADQVPLVAAVRVHDAGLAASLAVLLHGVYRADSVELAIARRRQLPAGARWVTPEGHIITAVSVAYFAAAGGGQGAVHRKLALDAASEALAELTPALAAVQAEIDVVAPRVADREATLRALQQQQLTASQHLAGLERALAAREADALAARLRREASSDALAELLVQIAENDVERRQAVQALAEADVAAAPLQAEVERAMQSRAAADAALATQRERLRQTERQLQADRFAAQSARDRLGELARRSAALTEQADLLGERLAAYQRELESTAETVSDGDVQQAVDLRIEAERRLAEARDALNGIVHTQREREADKQVIEQGLEPSREAISVLKLKEQEARLTFERYAGELVEAGADEAALVLRLGTGAKASSLLSEIGRLSQALNALGPVNLAALLELQEAKTRADYLDAQSADLLSAIETLESAIRRIDRETRALLQSTYDTVNANLQALFPALFGGGHAELHLTGDEILDAGLQIMAQPPGKKNSTIHLLSGGEKALTALSLVFSLFSLNPAPFCLLDEVDAPLDDANTLRFCDLVKKMAERTQFLYISHNRLTMEMAEQLVGVTMQEQGVSRVVAVDIQQALTMRDAALTV
ncbi:chromosome segregation protein SMC [Jeongeupia naejangsanensis]|uniref:Chromosome partition protein Smc n=1 Tax=Jeongeupia naejangsanensis TaxID=613195 RepID=A0ABS2BGZ3_9NEIS|nr:chromosome segregation protein SMC [Jeongeupia naejangsanensis]MBM3114201.1 chromosome segregation protein SMC [Jeongeupia naejangsanensis]